MDGKKRKNVERLFIEGKEIDSAMAKSVKEAIKMHKLLKKPYVISRRQKMVIVTPK